MNSLIQIEAHVVNSSFFSSAKEPVWWFNIEVKPATSYYEQHSMALLEFEHIIRFYI